MVRAMKPDALAAAILSLALVGCGGGSDVRSTCETIFDKSVELTVADAKARGADEAKQKEVRDAMPAQRDAYVKACVESFDDAKRACMVAAATYDAFKACMLPR